MKLSQIVIFCSLSTALFAAWGISLGVDGLLVALVAVVLFAAQLRGMMGAEL